MKVYTSGSIRNIALVGHQGSGKTSLTEAILFNEGITTRLGSTAEGNTVSDNNEEEIKRGLSLSTSIISIETEDKKFNLLDTPGYTDFLGEAKRVLAVTDLAVMMVDSPSGVEVGTEVYWGFLDEFQVPRIVVINKMHSDTARNASAILENLHTSFPGTRFVPVQVPIGEQLEFNGIVDLLTRQAWLGADKTPSPAPSDVTEAFDAARFALMEAAAESDDTLLEKYFEEGDLPAEDVLMGLAEGIVNHTFVPVLFVDAIQNIGVNAFFDFVKRVAPSPLESARTFIVVNDAGEEKSLKVDDNGPLMVNVFKTVADPFVGRLTYFRVVSGIFRSDSRLINVNKGEEERVGSLLLMYGKEHKPVEAMHAGDVGAVAKLNSTVTGDTLADKGEQFVLKQIGFPQPIYPVAVTPATQADSAKMGPILTRLCDEDPTLRWHQDSATHETILEGMGSVHIDVAIKRAQYLGVNLNTAVPLIPYRETITKTNSAQYRHKKQTGGSGQFAEVHLRVEPLDAGAGFEYASEVFGGAISHTYIPSIEKGIRDVMTEGVVAGYPVVDVKAVVFDGKEHPVDSKDIAFQIAGREAFKLAMMGAGPALLEPIMTMTVTVPETAMGDVIGDLNTRRGVLQGTDTAAGKAILTATVPLAEIQRYSNDLRSMTHGRGVYSIEFSHYQVVPAHLADGVVSRIKEQQSA